MPGKPSTRQLLFVLLLAVPLGLTACKSTPKKAEAPAASAQENAATEGRGAHDANAAGANADEETAGPQAGLLATRVIYFDFDSSEIKGAGTDVVAAHAKYLASTPAARVRLEGHTDERGSREYNIGLGERRAQAVRRALLLQGALDIQITTVSYGEERPAVPGHDEAAWAKNRRVEIIYLTPAPTAAAPTPKQ